MKINSDKLFNRFLGVVAVITVSFLVLLPVVLLVFIFKGPKIEYIAEGLGPAVAGSVVLVILALSFAGLPGIATGIWISEYLGGKWKRSALTFFRILAGVPSIIIGVCGFITVLFINKIFGIRLRLSLLTASFALALLILPYIVNGVYQGLSSSKSNLRVTAYTLGARKHQLIFRILIPGGAHEIFSGIVLAAGRAFEDTAVIMLTGAAAMAGFPSGLLHPFEALPFFIYYRSGNYSSREEFSLVLISALLLLIVSCLMIYIADYTHKKLNKKKKAG